MRIIFLSLFFVYNVSGASTLESSYQREILFLKTYKSQLRKQTQDLEKSYIKREIAAKQEIENLQKKLISLSTRNDKLSQKLSDLDREIEEVVESKNQLQTIVEQSREESFAKEISEEDLKVELISVFDQALKNLRTINKVKVSQGEFFLKNDEKTEGEIITIGQIAKYGVSEKEQGLLFPVGGHKFKIWSNLEDKQIANIKENKWSEITPVFLYESSERGYIPKVDKTPLQTVQAGGEIAWVIVILGVIALVASLLRVKLLWSAQAESVLRVTNSVKQSLAHKVMNIEDVIDEKILEESKTIDRFGQFIVVLAAVAPLLGLLGTVTGMIATFDTITQFGTGNPKLLSGGISEALITTMLGLMVAIPTLLLGNFLNSWSKKLKEEMERASLAICNAFATQEKL